MRKAKELRKDVEELAKPEGRLIGTIGHDNAKEFIVDRMCEMGLSPYKNASFEMPYKMDGTEFTNIIGFVPGKSSDKAPLLIGAHYDSVIAAPCADDNAAAVAIALASGEELMARAEKLERDIIIAVFDAEEPPHFQADTMGSNYFHTNQMDARGVQSAIVMDLVGHDVIIPKGLVPLGGIGASLASSATKSLLFITGAESAPEMPSMFEKIGSPRGLRLINTLNDYVGDMSDHGVFRRNGTPFLFLSCGRWEHYHQESDTPDKLSYGKMENILKYLIQMTEATASMELTNGVTDPDNSLKLETESLKKACSPFTPLLLKLIGLKGIETRKDIDTIATALMSTGL